MTEKNEFHVCPVCKKYVFEEYDSFDICPICGWEDDALQEKHPDYNGGANHVSLNQARKAYNEGRYIY